MNSRFTWVLLVVLGLAGCGEPEAPADQGFAGLGTAADGFSQVTGEREVSFPEDHAMHPDYRLEWWYVTANLEDETGRQFGVQWTLFRQALIADGEPAGWQDGQVWMAHAGLTRADQHHHAERFGRSGGGQAGVRTDPRYDVWLDDWQLTSIQPPVAELADSEDPLAHISVRARSDDFAFELALQSDRPLVRHGEAGYSVKSERGQASYYFSQPFYQANGELTLDDGERVQVRGQAWLDREWSSQPLAPEQTGWDWFSLHLDSGDKLMLFRLREQDDPDSFFAGTWVTPDGESTRLTPDQIELAPQSSTRVAGRDVPTHWTVAVPDKGVRLETEPLNAHAWMGASVPYWEGPVSVSGSHDGRGYLEMTGH